MKCIKILLCIFLLSFSIVCLAGDIDYLTKKEKDQCYKIEDNIKKNKYKHEEKYEEINEEFDKKLAKLEEKYNIDTEQYKDEYEKIVKEKENKIKKEKEEEEKDKKEIEKKKNQLEDKINTRLRREQKNKVIDINNIIFYDAKKITKTVKTRGFAAIINNDKESAMDKAILDCQVKALEEVIGVFIDAETTASNFTEINENIYKKVNGYIESCKPDEDTIEIKEIDGGKLLYITCTSVINVNQVFNTLQDIKTLYNKVGKPKFIILAKSKSNTRLDYCSIVESAFINELKKLDFDAVDPNMLKLQRSALDQNIKSYYSTLRENNVELAIFVDLQLDEKIMALLDTEKKNKSIWEQIIDIINKFHKIDILINIKLVVVKTGEVYFDKTYPKTFTKFFEEMSRSKLVIDVLSDFFAKDVEELKNVLFNKWAELSSENLVELTIKNVGYNDKDLILKEISEKERFFRMFEKKNFDNNKLYLLVRNGCDIDTFAKTLSSIVVDGKKLNIITVNNSEGIIVAELINFGITSNETNKAISDTIVNVNNITLNKTSLTMKKNYKCTLKATIIPENATNKKVRWETSDNSIVKVDQNGCVVGIKPGTAVINAITNDGNKIASCFVKIEK